MEDGGRMVKDAGWRRKDGRRKIENRGWKSEDEG